MASPQRTEFDPYSETLNLPANRDDAATESAAASPARDRVARRERSAALRRVTATLPTEPCLARFAEPLDRELNKLPLLDHPGILRVRAVARSETGWLIDFEATPSSATTTLEDDLQRHARPWRQAVEFVADLADIVASAHAAEIGHGVLSAEVILLTGPDKRPLIAAFGLGVLGRACRVEGSPALVGGPCTAPEQLESWPIPVSLRTDVYALGVVLYRMLCARYPFRAIDKSELQRAILEDAPQPPRQLAHGLPPQLEQLCLKLLAKDPSARPADAEAVSTELRRVLAETETTESGLGPLGARKPSVAQQDSKLWMVISWYAASDATSLQAAARDYVSQCRGLVLSQTESETIAQLPPSFGKNVTGMSAFLCHALTLLSELKPSDSVVQFAIDCAESDALKHRAPRLAGRVSAAGWEISPRTLETLRRWLPCRVTPAATNTTGVASRRASALARNDEPMGPGADALRLAQTFAFWEVFTAERWLPVRVVAIETKTPRPMVGRASQLAMLKARWEQAREGMGQIVLLIGDEGSGKTRLIQELSDVVAAANQESHWVRWSCRPGLSSESLHPATEFFRDSGIQLPAELTDETLQGITATQRRDRWEQGLLEWRKQLAATSPVVFVVEDLQWVDPATLAFLHRLIDLGISERVLTILTFRPEFETPWGSRAHQTQVALSRLTKRHVISMFSAIAGISEPPASLVDELLEATDGIPLFVEGFARTRNCTGEPEGVSPRT
jgi:serine/threonine protein kinase